jgi:hypothetical protein
MCDHCNKVKPDTKILTTGNGTNIGYSQSRWCMDCLIKNYPQYTKEDWDSWESE